MKKSVEIHIPITNQRIYPPDVLRRAIMRLQPDIAARRVIGQIDPPNVGESRLSQASHVVTALRVDPDDVVRGDIEFIDSEAGKLAEQMLLVDYPMHMTLRGIGSATDGVINDDFKICGVDIAHGPAPVEPDVIDKLAALTEEDEDAGD
jgi:hypothetical protein